MLISEEAKDILQEVINTGVGKAASSFSEILSREINLTFPTLLVFNYDQLMKYLKEKEQTEHVNIRQNFSGGLEGQGIVSFPLQDGKTLVNRLLENPNSDDPDFGILERETIMEVGNVLINAIGGSISNMVEIETHYQMPELDISKTVLLVDEDRDCIYCIGEGVFSVEGMNIQGFILFILTYNKTEHIINKLSYS